jgi:hypothetical protein
VKKTPRGYVIESNPPSPPGRLITPNIQINTGRIHNLLYVYLRCLPALKSAPSKKTSALFQRTHPCELQHSLRSAILPLFNLTCPTCGDWAAKAAPSTVQLSLVRVGGNGEKARCSQLWSRFQAGSESISRLMIAEQP